MQPLTSTVATAFARMGVPAELVAGRCCGVASLLRGRRLHAAGRRGCTLQGSGCTLWAAVARCGGRRGCCCGGER